MYMQGSLFLFCSSVAELWSALKVSPLPLPLPLCPSLHSLFLFLSVYLILSLPLLLYPSLSPPPPPSLSPSPSSSPLRPSRLWRSLPMNWPLRRMSLSLTLTHSLPPLKQSSPKSWRLQTGQAFVDRLQ